MKKPTAILLIIMLFINLIIMSSCSCKHEWKAATCTEPKTCSKCGKTEGTALGHNWKNATCTSPKTCSRCNATEGSALGHNWQAATCTKPKTCSRCNATEGSALGHDWKDATCAVPKTCRRCGMTSGAATNKHSLRDYKCTVCGKTIISASDVPNILDIVSLTYKVNSVGGIDQWIVIKNKSSSKTIKYVDYNVTYYNRVGDVAKDEVTRRDYATLRYTGPLGPNEQSNRNQYWEACFYCSTFGGTMSFKSITITYTDGSTLVLDKTVANKTVVDWR